ncbi:MAG TPA: efflux RND transporter periplasmic adaptor subunit [Bacteroidales bacterium]|jgi:RND family efflux transporter MFP subunit|nr:efflux RND transporter periplasmic adaptor subunit [Bacteroidales bacterium]HPR73627.1 efflux RND transporter periplasmic adaptor subunit [Bacteroidales bacterium]HRW86334.1 efflux RND transporter periplasmic adaptor subunit [Bacteroidales bacterium]
MNVRIFPVFLFITAVFFSCKPKSTENLEEMARRSSRPEAVLVKTVKLEPSTFYHELISNGKASSSQKAVVPFKVNGIIKELHIRNGQKVNAGDLLAVIEDFDYKTKLLQAQQGLEKAEINFKDDLLSNYYTSDTTGLSQAKIKISRIRSGINDAITSLEVARYNFNNTRIYAPISGVVANLEALQWNPSQNYKSLCTIIFDEVMNVEFPVIESEFSFISKGMPVGIIPFINDSTVINGTISQINPQVDETGMVKVKAEFSNNGRLIDGMNVKVVIRKPVPNRLVVPKEALVIRQGKDVIFVRQDSLAIWRYVTVEFENSTSVSVKDTPDGIHAGDLVIITGNVNLAHETIVREE